MVMMILPLHLGPVSNNTLAPSTSHEDFELRRAVMIAQWEAEHAEDVSPIAETRVDAVDLMSRIASFRLEVGTSTWSGRCSLVDEAFRRTLGGGAK